MTPTAPKPRDWLFWLLSAIAVMTVVTGAVQAAAPAFVLNLLHTEVTPASAHFFRIVGMFMALFGGAMLHALFSREDHPIVVLWGALQKFGASVAVTIGVFQGVFSSLAWLVAVTDLLSGVAALWYWQRIRSPRP